MTWIDDAAHACARAGYAVGVTQTSDHTAMRSAVIGNPESFLHRVTP